MKCFKVSGKSFLSDKKEEIVVEIKVIKDSYEIYVLKDGVDIGKITESNELVAKEVFTALQIAYYDEVIAENWD